MQTRWPKEPTADQCSANARVEDWNGEPAYACWYPQMGGYGSFAVVVPGPVRTANQGAEGAAGCFEAFVWHDGEFPFSGEDGGTRRPVHLHHCDPVQFIEFGEWVAGLTEAVEETGSSTDHDV